MPALRRGAGQPPRDAGGGRALGRRPTRAHGAPPEDPRAHARVLDDDEPARGGGGGLVWTCPLGRPGTRLARGHTCDFRGAVAWRLRQPVWAWDPPGRRHRTTV